MGVWVDITPVAEGVRDWLDTQLPATATVLLDEAPAQLTGPTVVVETVAGPREGPPLAGLDTLELTVTVTSMAWDATAKRSIPAQARALADQVARLLAGTTPTGAPLEAISIPDHVVLRAVTAGDGRPVKNGALWSVPETFTLTVLADPPP